MCVCIMCMHVHTWVCVCAENRLSLSPKPSTDSSVQLLNQASHTAASLDTGGFESLGVDLSWEQFFFFHIHPQKELDLLLGYAHTYRLSKVRASCV